MSTPDAPRARNAYAAPAWAAEQRTGSVGLKATLLVLANYADENFSCYPSQATIALETEQSVSTVRRQVKLLEAVGLFRRIKRYNEAGKRSSDRFVLNLDRVVTVEEVAAAESQIRAQAGRTTDHQVTGSPDGDTPDDALPVKMEGSPDTPSTNAHQVTGSAAATTGQTEPTTGQTPGDYRSDTPGDYRSPGERGTPKELLHPELPGELLAREPARDDGQSVLVGGDLDGQRQSGGEAEATVTPIDRPRRRKGRIPADFAVTDKLAGTKAGQEAIAAGIDLGRETQQFADHHRAKGTAMLDWDLAWQTWMRNAVDWGRRGTGGAARPAAYSNQVWADQPDGGYAAAGFYVAPDDPPDAPPVDWQTVIVQCDRGR